VRLLFDHNLSPRLVAILASLYGSSTHVRNEGLQRADDDTVWAYAIRHEFLIVSKDADFHQRSFVLGHPQLLIHLRALVAVNYDAVIVARQPSSYATHDG
jgi:predicted nuclease of predicted toxin-antitoxin system